MKPTPARKRVAHGDVAGELLPGASEALLKALHLLTREGDLNADARRKLKQINHFIGLLWPALDDVLGRHPSPLVVDCGAGKSYLGALIQQVVFGPPKRGRVISIEARADLAASTAALAHRVALPITSMHAAVATVTLEERVHVVTALHACDTATDDAIVFGIRHGANYVAVVPCCQAEVAGQLKAKRPDDAAMATLCAHPWHRREFGSHLTNVMRALYLEANGYQVTVTELAGWEHSLKNELILGKRIKRHDAAAAARLAELVARTGVCPKLLVPVQEPPPVEEPQI